MVIKIFCLCCFSLGKCLGVLSWSSHWVDYLWLNIIIIKDRFFVFILSSNGSFMLHKNSMKHILKCWTFWLSLSAYGTHLLSFFTLPIFLMTWYWNTDMLCLNPFSDTLTLQQVFSDVGLQLAMDVLHPLDIQDWYLLYGTFETSGMLSNHN